MKKALLLFGALALVVGVFNSCQKSSQNTSSEEVSQEVLNAVRHLGFSTDEVKPVEGGYIVEGDIFLSEEELSTDPETMHLLVGDNEQYHTYNLVTGLPRTIKVFINSGSGGGKLPASYGAGLDEVVSRYNAQNLGLTFQRVYTASEGQIDIVKGNGGYLASAGFPSGGNPYPTVKVNSTAIGSNPPLGYLATILAHEVGHCIGFRHTDYMDRSYSCGGGYANEGTTTYGAEHIPGTPTGPDPNSWMLACIGSGQNRTFNANDKTALNYLY